MKINKFVWLDEIIHKLDSKHNVQQYEVLEIFDTNPYFRFVEHGHRESENVYAALGQTDGGRYLIVFFVYKKDRNALIISARDMTSSERRHYEKR
ncbi:MAG: BrnT family toxin [Candidatus Eremiobacterota bacterium]